MGELPGTYYFVFDSFAQNPSDPSETTYTGTSTITTKQGVIYTEDTGVTESKPPEEPAAFETTAKVESGTRKFAHTSGTFVATGTLTLGVATGTYEATLCKPRFSL